MSKNKKPKLKAEKLNKILISIATVVTATAALLKVIFDFVIQLISLD